jgi:preprotein translocase subunit SecF
MKSIKLTCVFFVIGFLAVIPHSLFAVDASEKSVLDTGNVEQQLEFIISKSTTYDQYKVIKITSVNKVKSNVLDTIKSIRSNFNASEQMVLSKQAQVDSLTSALENTQTQLDQTIKEKNSVSFMGLQLSKAAYKSTIFFIIVSLASLLVILFLAFRRSNAVTVHTKHELEALTDEFEAHKKRAREREEQLARKHLDEILKYKEKRHSQA